MNPEQFAELIQVLAGIRFSMCACAGMLAGWICYSFIVKERP